MLQEVKPDNDVISLPYPLFECLQGESDLDVERGLHQRSLFRPCCPQNNRYKPDNAVLYLCSTPCSTALKEQEFHTWSEGCINVPVCPRCPPPHGRYKPDADDVHGQHRFTLDSKHMSKDLQVGACMGRYGMSVGGGCNPEFSLSPVLQGESPCALQGIFQGSSDKSTLSVAQRLGEGVITFLALSPAAPQ